MGVASGNWTGSWTLSLRHVGGCSIHRCRPMPRPQANGWSSGNGAPVECREAQATRAKKKWSPRPRGALMPPMPRHNEGDNTFTSS